MSDVLAKALSFVVLIILGYVLKSFGILKKEDRVPLLNIVFYITLPCILISSFKSFEYSNTLFVAISTGFLATVLLFVVAFIVSIKSHTSFKRSSMMVPSGFAVGTFTIPFAATFLGPESLIFIAMFDMGHAIMGLGGTYAAVASITGSSETVTVKTFFKRLFSSVPFDTYLIMLFINFFDIHIPGGIYIFTDFAGSATAFIVMITIGLMLEVNIQKKSIKEVFLLLTIRYAVVTSIGIVIFFGTTLPHEYKLALLICLFAPPSTSSVIFSQKLQCSPNVISAVQSLSIPISILCSSAIILLG